MLLHGITTYSFIWRKVVPLLRDHFEVITVDLLGCGDSEKPLEPSYSIKAHAARLVEFADKLNLDKFHIVGHDLGGGIAQIFAVHNPERLHSMTLINPVAYDLWPVAPVTSLRTPIIRQFLMASVDFGSLEFIVRKGLYNRQLATPELMELFLKPLKSREGRKAFLHFARCLNSNDLTEISEEIGHLHLPVLIVRGDADPYLSRAISQRLHQAIRDSKMLVIDTAGHYIQEDEPQQLATAILSFINGRKDLVG